MSLLDDGPVRPPRSFIEPWHNFARLCSLLPFDRDSFIGGGGSSSVSESNFPRSIDRSFGLIIRGFLNRRSQPVRGRGTIIQTANICFFPRIKSIISRQSDVSSFESRATPSGKNPFGVYLNLIGSQGGMDILAREE